MAALKALIIRKFTTRLPGNSFGCGAVWVQYCFTAFEKYPAETEADFEKIITSPEDPRPIGVIPDSRGILRSLHCLRNLGYLKEIVILVSTATPKEYLNYLEERHYPYIVSGNDHVDYEKAFQILHEQYGCKYMRTDSGGGLTNKLLENGLIDEISLVISPCFVGNKENNYLITFCYLKKLIWNCREQRMQNMAVCHCAML